MCNMLLAKLGPIMEINNYSVLLYTNFNYHMTLRLGVKYRHAI